MNAFRAVELRSIFPLLLRWATVDFFVTVAAEDFFEVLFDFDEVIFEDDDERVDDRELDEPWEPPF